ncbi:TPA: accessory Sec system protein Asp1 [Streptococcus agalactiae]
MFYFVPSWYNKDRKWYDTTPFWFRVYERMEFDDTINQVKLFRNAEEKLGLLILNYQPQLRYGLHKQDLLSENYWSFFDDIQNLSGRETKSVKFQDLNWPRGVQFIHSPFAVAVRKDHKTIGVVHFAENGNIRNIERYVDGQMLYDYVFDDRGFLSSLVYMKDGKAVHQDYLNKKGLWQVREHLTDDRKIEINPQADKSFEKESYANWEELIHERLSRFKEDCMSTEDKIVIAAHTQHNQLIAETFAEQKQIYSLFAERFDIYNQEAMSLVLEKASLIVTEQNKVKEELRKIQRDKDQKVPVLHISPFDTRLRLGHSQNVKELIIYFYVDSISREELWKNLKVLLPMMEADKTIQLFLVSYQHSSNFPALKEEVNNYIIDKLDAMTFFTPKEDSSENLIDEITEMENNRINYKVFTNETDIIKVMDTTRLILDLGEHTDLYTHIAAISAGIPQINSHQTEYVDNKKNGMIISKQTELAQAIEFYFDGLANWNQALVYAVQKMADYTSGKILKQWKELLKHG